MVKSSNFDRLDIEQFQKTVFAGQHQIICFVKTSKVPYYVGPYLGPGKQLLLYLSDGHYSGVRSVCALLKTRFYCFLCNTRYTDASSHYSCPLIHRLCGKPNCSKTKTGEEIRCEACTVLFHSQECYDNHRKKGNLKCEYPTHVLLQDQMEEEVVVIIQSLVKNVMVYTIQIKTKKLTNVARSGVTDVTVREPKNMIVLCQSQSRMRRN